MKISPLDIRKQTFRTVFRGADNEEVRVFLDLVATEYENALQENLQLTERLQHCEDRLVEYRELDQTLRNSLLTAERLAAQARDASQREANLVIQDAEWRAKQMLEDARERLGRLSEEVRDLQSMKDSFAQHLRSFLQSHLELLDRNDGFLEGIDRLADDVRVLASHAHRVEAETFVPQASMRPAPPTAPPAERSEPIPSIPREGLPPSPIRPPEAPPPARAAYPFDTTGRPSAPPAKPAGRGLGRFHQGAGPGEPAPGPTGRGPGDPGPRSRREPGGPERNEGLFEISADEESPPPS